MNEFKKYIGYFDIEELQIIHAGMIKAKPYINKKTKGYAISIGVIEKLSYLIKDYYR